MYSPAYPVVSATGRLIVMARAKADHAQVCAVLPQEKVRKHLYERLENEMYAFIRSSSLDHMANMLGTMNMLSCFSGRDMCYVEALADQKKRDNGGFDKRYILTL